MGDISAEQQLKLADIQQRFEDLEALLLLDDEALSPEVRLAYRHQQAELLHAAAVLNRYPPGRLAARHERRLRDRLRVRRLPGESARANGQQPSAARHAWER